MKWTNLISLEHKWGKSVDFVTKFRLYSTQLKLPEVVQLQIFEDRINPLIRTKLINLPTNERNIENYCKTLMTYDSERDRH